MGNYRFPSKTVNYRKKGLFWVRKERGPDENSCFRDGKGKENDERRRVTSLLFTWSVMFAEGCERGAESQNSPAEEDPK